VKNLVQHIESLIIKHECVIVPGFGGFLTYRDKAIVRNNRLYAPTQRIRFNSLLTYHDGLLAEAYMQDRHISYTEAIQAIKADVEQITTSLHAGNTFLFGRIGSLSLINGNITLRDIDCKFLPENIGLPVVHLKQLASSTNNSNTIILNVPRVSSNALRYVAMLTIISILSLLIPTPTSNSTHEASFYKQFTNYKTQNINDSIKNIKTINTTESIQTIDSTNTINSSPLTTNSLQKKYHLIIASLTSRKDAETYISNHTIFDRSKLIIIETNGKYRISAISFTKYNDAIDYMDSIRNNVPTAQKAWILCK
jgi:nucleoid DNA-binding protein